MAVVKHIRDNSGAGKEFESVTTSEITYDTTPQLGSFNPVVSDGIAKALEVATEIPVVSADTDGMVLTASWNSETGTGSTSWDVAQGTEYTAGTGIAISDENVISCTVQSPSAGDGIKIENNTVSAYHGETLVDKALPLAFKTGAERRTAFIGAGNWSYYTALKVSFGDIVPNSTLLTVSIKNSTSSSDVILAMPYTTVDPDLGGKKVKVVFANPDNKSNYIEARYASNVEITQGTGSQGSYNAKVSAPAVVINNSNFQDGFDWHGLTLADIQGADGTTLMYVVACASDGTLITTGSYGPTDNMWTVGFGNGYMPSATTYALVEMPSNPVGFDVKNPVPAYTTSEDGKVLGVVDNSGTAELQWVSAGGGDQPLPAIPAYSLRFQFSDTSFDPTTPLAVTNGTWSPVDAGSGIWDFTYQNSTWTNVFIGKFVDSVMGNVYADVIGGDLAGVTHAERLFADCNRIKKFNLECDISSMVSMAYLFGQWNGGVTQELVEFNLMNTSTNATNLAYINGMFNLCYGLKKVSISISGNAPEAREFLNGVGSLTECTLRGFTGFGNPTSAFNGTSSLESLKIVLLPGNLLFNLYGDCTSMFNYCWLKNMQSSVPILGCSNVTNASYMFQGTSTQDLPMMVDTGNITDFTHFCEGNNLLRSIPYIDVSSATDVEYMFNGCNNVQYGALNLYKQLSTKATPPSTTTDCFTNCGVNTTSGNIELAKIPTSYGGLGYESASSASVTLPVNDLVVSDSVDVTSITVGSGVTSGIVQWVVNSTTTLPTVTDSNNVALKASVNNPASLTVGRTVQVSILNGTWVYAEFA